MKIVFVKDYLEQLYTEGKSKGKKYSVSQRSDF